MINNNDLLEIHARQIEIDAELSKTETLILINEAETMLLNKRLEILKKEAKNLNIIMNL